VSTVGLVVVTGGEPGPPVVGSGTLLVGMSLLDRAVEALRACPHVDRVLVVAPGEPLPDAAHAGADVVVLHDASFPLVDATAVGAVLDALRADPRAAAAVAVLPVTDTLKQVTADGAVLATVDRTGLRVAGSPQAYRAHLLPADVAARFGFAPPLPPHRLPSDPLPAGHRDAAALPRALVGAGRRVVLVDAPPAAFRVRTELDLLAARALLGEA
jgi:2-C-methyl-D-erythritol 4-phosphate cytidylyltransferase